MWQTLKNCSDFSANIYKKEDINWFQVKEKKAHFFSAIILLTWHLLRAIILFIHTPEQGRDFKRDSHQETHWEPHLEPQLEPHHDQDTGPFLRNSKLIEIQLHA